MRKGKFEEGEVSISCLLSVVLSRCVLQPFGQFFIILLVTGYSQNEVNNGGW